MLFDAHKFTSKPALFLFYLLPGLLLSRKKGRKKLSIRILASHTRERGWGVVNHRVELGDEFVV
jgi:hypothetical protein